MSKERIRSIDSLKGIACIVIAFLWHYLNMQSRNEGMPFEPIFGYFYNVGQYFVELFFLLSGFVMAYCYKEKIDAGMDLFSYMKKRYKHLYPLFFSTLMFMMFMQIFYNSITGDYYIYRVSIWHLVLNLLCIQTGWLTTDQSFNGPAWCISVEIFLYLLYYITTKFSKRDKDKYRILNVIIFIISLSILYSGGIDKPLLNSFMLRGVVCFYSGVIVCELNECLDNSQKNKYAMSLFLGLIIFRFAIHFSSYSFWDQERNGQFMLIILEWPIVVFSAINNKLFRKILEFKPLEYLGKISMDIFLWHIPVQISFKTINALLDLNIDFGSRRIWLTYVIAVCSIVALSNVLSKYRNQQNYFRRFIITLFVCACIVLITEKTGIRYKAILDNSLLYSSSNSVVELEKGVSLREQFCVKKQTNLEKLQFYTITWHRKFLENQYIYISIINLDTGENIYFEEKPLSAFRDGDIYNCTIDKNVILMPNTKYCIEMKTNSEEEQESIALMLNENSNSSDKLFVGDTLVDNKHIALKLWSRETKLNFANNK